MNPTDIAYAERNMLVALLSKMFPSGRKRTVIDGWDECWQGCVYIDFPWGQASWHYHDRDAGLFAHLGEYLGEWDGHTTLEKYQKINAATEREYPMMAHSIGQFVIHRHDDTRFWLHNTNVPGEGGTVKESELEDLIAKFYRENF